MSSQKINLLEALDLLELVLGKDWLEENLKIIKDGSYSHGGFGRNIDFKALGIAHVGKTWYKAREETIGMEIAGGGLPGPYSLSAAAMAADIKVLKDNIGFDGIIDALKDPKLSLIAMQQMAIASGYALKGYNIDFTGLNGLDGLPFHGSAAPVNAFIARGGDNEVMIMCIDVNMQGVSSEAVSSIANYLYKQEGQVEGTIKQRVLYLHVGDTLKEAVNLLQHWTDHAEITRLTGDYGVPVLVYTTGLKIITNLPVYVRWGRLVKGSNETFIQYVYIPDEVILPV